MLCCLGALFNAPLPYDCWLICMLPSPQKMIRKESSSELTPCMVANVKMRVNYCVVMLTNMNQMFICEVKGVKKVKGMQFSLLKLCCKT